MKRELKQLIPASQSILEYGQIAKPIPMKRELKPIPDSSARRIASTYCKAYPDEKGIETLNRRNRPSPSPVLQSLSR